MPDETPDPLTTAPAAVPGPAAVPAETRELAATTAAQAQAYLDTVTEVATGRMDETALSVLLLAVSQALLAGARLGAVADFVPAQQFEPDAGPDPDVDPVRVGLANVMEGLDDYADVFAVAHNSGDDVRATLDAVAAGADVIEVDVIALDGQLYAAHAAPPIWIGRSTSTVSGLKPFS